LFIVISGLTSAIEVILLVSEPGIQPQHLQEHTNSF